MQTRRFLGALALLPLALGCREAQQPLHGNVIPDPLPAPALRLPNARGGTFDLATEGGRGVLVYFGYTHCPDVCPTTLADFARARAALGTAQQSMRFVFVSVDPERDTPAISDSYARRFDSTFVGLATTAAQLDTIKTAWGFAVVHEEMPGMKPDQYGVSHPAGVFYVHRDGTVRVVFAPGTRPDDIAADLKQLLR